MFVITAWCCNIPGQKVINHPSVRHLEMTPKVTNKQIVERHRSALIVWLATGLAGVGQVMLVYRLVDAGVLRLVLALVASVATVGLLTLATVLTIRAFLAPQPTEATGPAYARGLLPSEPNS